MLANISVFPLTLVFSGELLLLLFFKILLGERYRWEWWYSSEQPIQFVWREPHDQKFWDHFNFEKQFLSFSNNQRQWSYIHRVPQFPILSSDPFHFLGHLPLDCKLLESCSPNPFISGAVRGVDSPRYPVDVQVKICWISEAEMTVSQCSIFLFFESHHWKKYFVSKNIVLWLKKDAFTMKNF